MAQRGRKTSLNVVSLAATGAPSRLTAPAMLTKAERRLFVETAAANPHLRPADTPLLGAYAQAWPGYRLARQTDAAAVTSWEKAMRVAMALATKLRITAQAQVHPETAGRKQPSLPPSAYDLMMANDDDD